ncbi:unnamed protein product [Chrysoparadoxa australica]
MQGRTPLSVMAPVFDRPTECNHVNICAALYRVAKIGPKPALLPKREKALLSRLLRLADDMVKEKRLSGRQLCNVAWAIGKLQVSRSDTMQLIGDQLAADLEASHPEVRPGEVAMAAHAFAVLRNHHESLLEAVAGFVCSNPSAFKKCELANITWAFASLGHYSDVTQEMMEDVVQELKTCINALNAQDISMLAWSYAQLLKDHWILQDCTDTLLVHVVAPAALVQLESFQPRDLAETALAMARAGVDHETLMKGIVQRSLLVMEAFPARELANLSLALAKLDVRDEQFRKVLPVMTARLCGGEGRGEEPKTQELANIAWSCAVLEVEDEELLKMIFKMVEGEYYGRGRQLPGEELRQLYQVWLVYRRGSPGAFKGLSRRFLRALTLSWKEEKMRPKSSSARHLAISKHLSLMRVSHQNESEHDIDIEVVGYELHEGRGKVKVQLALEVDGPAHFARNTRRQLGHTKLKHRMLKEQGWHVVRIPFYEWDPIPHFCSMEKKRYLQRKLGITQTIFFSGE